MILVLLLLVLCLLEAAVKVLETLFVRILGGLKVPFVDLFEALHRLFVRVTICGVQIGEWTLLHKIFRIDERELDDHRTGSTIGDFAALELHFSVVGDSIRSALDESQAQRGITIAQNERVVDALPRRAVSCTRRSGQHALFSSPVLYVIIIRLEHLREKA